LDTFNSLSELNHCKAAAAVQQQQQRQELIQAAQSS
jgi:hypothetical protein